MRLSPLLGFALLTAQLAACTLATDFDRFSKGGPGGSAGAAGSNAGSGGSAGSEGGAAGSGGDAGGEGGAAGSGGEIKEGIPCDTPDATACVGVAQQGVLVCKDGSWAKAPDCDANQRCDSKPGPTSGTCQPVAPGCEGKNPNDLSCDGVKRIKCSEDLLGSSLLDTCVSEQTCAKSTGEKCISCVAGEFICAGEKLLRCNDNGSVDPIQDCASAALCDTEGGKCVPPKCQKGEATCDGDQLRTCLDDLTDFDAGIACDPGLCDADGKQCDKCKANEAACTQDGKQQTCSSDGQQLTEAACPVETPFCIGAGKCVACEKDEQCPQPPGECVEAKCLSNACVTQNKLDGTLAATQTANDCKKNTCTNGKITSENDDTDLPKDDGNDCTLEQCIGGSPKTTNAPNFTKCAQGACISGKCNANPSCTDQATDYVCGQAQNTNCCLSKDVPAGTFARGYDVSSDPTAVIGRQAAPTATATLSAFKLETFEVSVRRFRKFANAYPQSLPKDGDGAGGGFPGWKSSWKSDMPSTSAELVTALKTCSDPTWSDIDGGPNDGRPISCVSWYEAVAFCLWDGGRLASEAQWNYAAAGGDEQRAYPWSSPAGSVLINETLASYSVDTSKFCFGDKKAGCTTDDIVQTGSFKDGAGRWGHLDLGGNLGEWVLDSLVDVSAYPPDDCTDCVIHNEGPQAITRGGAFDEVATSLRTAYRFGVQKSLHYRRMGFRCVRP